MGAPWIRRTLLVSLIACVLSSCRSGIPVVGTPAVNPGQRLAGESRAVLAVEGMGCELCVVDIVGQLSPLAGVQNVRVDLALGEVHLDLLASNRLEVMDLDRALAAVGFSIRAVKEP